MTTASYADSGSSLVSLRTADTAWLRRLLWRLGSQATVLEPASLAAEVRAGAERALAAYAAPDLSSLQGG